MITDWLRMKRAEYSARAAMADAQEKYLKEATTFSRSADQDIWNRYSNQSTSGETTDLDPGTHARMQAVSYRLYKRNPWARSIVASFRKLIFGQNFSVSIDDRGLQDRFDTWSKEIRFTSRMRELGKRSFRDGETFLRLFPRGAASPADLRFIGPWLVRDERKNVAQPDRAEWGIEFDPRDAETPLRYHVVKEAKRDEPRPDSPYNAAQVVHVKINCDSEFPRGVPIYEPILWILPQIQTVIESRIILHQYRTAIVGVKTIEGGPSAVNQIKAALEKERGNTADTSRRKMLKPGTVEYMTPGIKLDFVSPKFEAGDAYEDIRVFLLTLCAGTELAEFMVTADASNANYSSTLAAESPAVRAIQDYQEEFDPHIERIVRQSLGLIAPQYGNDTRKVKIDAKWPPIVYREPLEETKALSLQYHDQAISLETYREKLGYNNGEETERIKREAPDLDDLEGDDPALDLEDVPPDDDQDIA